MAINLAKYIADENQSSEEASEVHRLVGKWLAETRSSKSVIKTMHVFLCIIMIDPIGILC